MKKQRKPYNKHSKKKTVRKTSRPQKQEPQSKRKVDAQQHDNSRQKQQTTPETQLFSHRKQPTIHYLIYAIIIILSIGLYSNTIKHEYLFDDPIVVTLNKFTTNEDFGYGIKKIMTTDAFAGIFGGHGGIIQGGRYRPLSIITFAIEWHLFAEGFRITDRSLHLLQEEKVPEQVLQKLATIKNRDFETESDFDTELKKVLSQNEFNTYRDAIYKYPKHLKGNPYISHFINVLLYAITGVIVFMIFVRIFSNSGIYHNPFTAKFQKYGVFRHQWYLSVPFIATILFVVHPLHTEVVANIKERDDIMALLGSLLTLLFVLKFLETKKWLHIGLACFFYVLGFLSKENTVTFMAVIPLTIFMFVKNKPIAKTSGRRRQTEKPLKKYKQTVLPLLITTIVLIIIRQIILGEAAENNIPNKLMNDPFLYATIGEKYATIFYTLGLYLKLLFVPYPLTVDYYPYHIPLISWTDFRAIIPLLLYLALGIYALTRLKRKSIISYSIWFYIITLSIVSNLFFPIGTFMGERFLYFSSIGFCIFIAYFFIHEIPHFVARKKTSLVKPTTILLLSIIIATTGVYAYRTVDRNQYWQDDYTLFTHDAEVSRQSAKSNHVLGELYLYKALDSKDDAERDSLLDLSIKYSRRGVEIHERYVRCWHNLGVAIYERHGDYKEAAECFQHTLENQPFYDITYQYLKKMFAEVKDNAFKLQFYQKIYQLAPTRYEVNSNLGTMHLVVKNDLKKAKFYLDRAIEVGVQDKGGGQTFATPKELAADYNNLGVIYNRQGNLNKSVEMFEKAYQTFPHHINYIKNLYNTYKMLGNQEKAAFYYQKLVQLQGKK